MRDDQAMFVATLERYLTQVLERYVGVKLDRAAFEDIKHELHVRLREMFNKTELTVSEDSISFIASEYFAGININGKPLNEYLIYNPVPVDMVPTADIAPLLELFRDTTIGDKLDAERTKRH